jgi:hypothetical protein
MRAAAVLSAFSLTIPLAAQKPPDFSGTWRLDEARTAAANKTAPSRQGGGAILRAGPLRITQDATTLTLTREALGMPIRYALRLDGAESVNKNGAMTRTTQSRWMNGRLVTEGTDSQVTSQGYAEWKLRETLSRRADGTLVIETTQASADGRSTTRVEMFRHD